MTALQVIDRCRLLNEAIAAGDYSAASILIEQAIPCIMHMENRCAEKMLKLLISEGWDRCKKDGKKQSTFLSDFASTVNSYVLGTTVRQSNWSVTVAKDKEGKTIIGDQSMYNYQVRKFLREGSFNRLIDVALKDDSVRQQQWKVCIVQWNLMMDILRKHDDFSDDDIALYEHVADTFFDNWVKLHSRDGLTNYFHMIGSGHIAYYLRNWRNMYKYSQQGWEALNKYIKAYFFHRTQMGGFGGHENQENSRLDPIARWMQRSLIFLCWDDHAAEIHTTYN